MAEYLISVIEPVGPVPPPEFLEPIMRQVEEVHRQMRDAGAWVFSGALFPPHTATVLQRKDDDVLATDGPYVEGREHLGGFTIVDVPDLDAALTWGNALAAAIGLPIEVRPFRQVER